MTKDIYLKKKLTSSWFSLLQQTICYEFEKIEIDFGKKTRQNPKCFKKNCQKFKKQKKQKYKIIQKYKRGFYKGNTEELQKKVWNQYKFEADNIEINITGICNKH